jgi:pyruvate/2-oxoglutarate dehydrogenase complex dihydrolipoamide acyltransferase (E2) component
VTQNLQQQILRSVRDFVGDSLGGTKGQLQGARTQLEEFAGQVPQEEAQAEVQEMVDSLYLIESTIDRAAQDQGLGDAVDEAAQQGGGGKEPNATQAAVQRAEELGVDLSQVEGTGSEGRITVKDVTGAANQG